MKNLLSSSMKFNSILPSVFSRFLKADTPSISSLNKKVVSSDKNNIKQSVMLNNLKYLWIGLNQLGAQKLDRIPEPFAVMDEAQSVNDFDQLIKTQTYCMYLYILNLCERLEKKGDDGFLHKRALDIACGPGNLSMQLSQVLNYEKVWGIDLSDKMLNRAQKNTENFPNQFQFLKMNASQLEFEDNFFDLSIFFQSAHHIDSLLDINKIIQETERVTNDNGVIVVGDLCRFRTAQNAERFINTACAPYQQMGLDSLYEDSVNSINAAWTQDELVSAIPPNTKRDWYTFKLWPAAAYCFLVSPGKNDSQAFIRKSELKMEKVLPQNLKSEYNQLLFSARIGEKLRKKIT